MSGQQEQMILPLLEVLAEHGGAATAQEAYSGVAAKLRVPLEAQQASEPRKDCSGVYNLFQRDVRWARQKAVDRGLVASQRRNVWALTRAGKDGLKNARPGVVVTVYETDLGVCLWAECESAMALLNPGSINLILTSPPYPLLTRKAYAGQHAEREHIQWLARCAEQWARVLAADGSLMLNLGDVFTSGEPTMSLWQERLVLELVDKLGLRLAQKLFWENPSKMPGPASWVTVKRVRLTPSVEQVWWLSKSANPKSDNRRVLRPYSTDMQRKIARGGDRAQRRPSGHVLREGSFGADNGGSIPHNLLIAANTRSRGAYQEACRAQGLPVHPARFPEANAELGIRLTTEEGDAVLDPFGGSNTVGVVAERLGRRWVTVEKGLAYIMGGANHFGEAARLVVDVRATHDYKDRHSSL